jgi:hypothetical protein
MEKNFENRAITLGNSEGILFILTQKRHMKLHYLSIYLVLEKQKINNKKLFIFFIIFAKIFNIILT